MRVLLVGTEEKDLAACRHALQKQSVAIVGSVMWNQAIEAYDALQPEFVVLASDPLSPLAIGVVWLLRDRDPFLPILPYGIALAPVRTRNTKHTSFETPYA